MMKLLALIGVFIAVGGTSWGGAPELGISLAGGPGFLPSNGSRSFGTGSSVSLAVVVDLASHIEADLGVGRQAWTRDDETSRVHFHYGHGIEGNIGGEPYQERLRRIGVFLTVRALPGGASRRLRPYAELGLVMGRLSVSDTATKQITPYGRVGQADSSFSDKLGLFAGAGLRGRISRRLSLGLLITHQWLRNGVGPEPGASSTASFPDIQPSFLAVHFVITLHGLGGASTRNEKSDPPPIRPWS